jgi:hypothetical protein
MMNLHVKLQKTNRMKNVFLLLVLLPFCAQSQISIQAYSGNKETEILGILIKTLSANGIILLQELFLTIIILKSKP